MKNLKIITVSICLSFMFSVSKASDVNDEEPTIHERCDKMGGVSQTVMQLRQFGIPMTKMMSQLEEGYFVNKFKPQNPEWFNKLVRNIIMSAYGDYPNSYNQVSKNLILDSFVSNWVAACYEHFENR